MRSALKQADFSRPIKRTYRLQPVVVQFVPVASQRLLQRDNQIEDAVIAQFALRPTQGHREVREDKCEELWLGELNRDRRCGGAFWHLAHPDMVSRKA